MSDGNDYQTDEELQAQYEANAEAEFNALSADIDVDYEHGKRILQYAHSQMKHFMQIDHDLLQGLITFEGIPYICSFHRTVDNLIEDEWSIDIASVEFIGTTDMLEELANRNDYIMLVEHLDIEDEED